MSGCFGETTSRKRVADRHQRVDQPELATPGSRKQTSTPSTAHRSDDRRLELLGDQGDLTQPHGILLARAPLFYATSGPACRTRLEQEDDRYGGVTASYYDAAYAVLRAPTPGRGVLRASSPALREVRCSSSACGTGRVLLEIAKQGIACAGVDLSPGMLARLRAKGAPPSLRLVQAPMQRFDLGSDRFALIYSAFRGFQHLYTVEDQLACLACVRRHLAPGGAFAFDVFNPRLDADGCEPRSPRRWACASASMARRSCATSASSATPGRSCSGSGCATSASGPAASSTSEEVEFQMRWFYRYEVEHLLARAGFRDVAVYGDFAKQPFGADSPDDHRGRPLGSRVV